MEMANYAAAILVLTLDNAATLHCLMLHVLYLIPYHNALCTQTECGYCPYVGCSNVHPNCSKCQVDLN